jgi:cobalt-zinc-cadmium efflux system membrane fusion protein
MARKPLIALLVVVSTIALGVWTRVIPLAAWRLTSPTAAPNPGHPASQRRSWDGLITVDRPARDAIGIRTATVQLQTEPIELELPGTTAYDPDSLTKLRPRFDALVSKVHASLGQSVHKGDPLVELYSAQLAEAKTSYETKRAQWLYDKRLLETREPLVEEGAVSQQLFAETQNHEMKSRIEYKVARDELLVYGLTDEEIDAVPEQDGSDKARMTLRSTADGIVISRDVVPGNLYETSNVLMVIAPLDHLWVWVNVYEADLAQVRTDQALEIHFPFLERRARGRIEYVSSEVHPDTHAVRARATISNPGGLLKADMLVRAVVEIPPEEGQTTIPRIALVSTGGDDYVFVQRPDRPEKFERRPIGVVQERRDRVVAKGLHEGEEVVTNGSLWMADLYEDEQTVHDGAPTTAATGGS